MFLMYWLLARKVYCFFVGPESSKETYEVYNQFYPQSLLFVLKMTLKLSRFLHNPHKYAVDFNISEKTVLYCLGGLPGIVTTLLKQYCCN